MHLLMLACSLQQDGQDLLEDPNTDGHFEFDSVSRNDEGLYECEASSVGGVATNDMTLDVKSECSEFCICRSICFLCCRLQ